MTEGTVPLAKVDTLLAQAGGEDLATGGVVPPLQLSTTFARDTEYELPSPFIYSRYGNPTASVVEEVIAALEGGGQALAFASGLTATTAILNTLRTGDRLVAPTVMYHGAQEWMRRLRDTKGVVLDFFDPSDPNALGESLASGPAAMVWIEGLVNPTWDVLDIALAARLAHAAGAVLVVDSTVAPPVTTRPLDLGADFVLHSATKYLNGHSDVLGGVLVTRRPAERWADVARVRTLTGGILGAFEAWLLLRGLRTLGVRFDRSSRGALELARHFEAHPAIERVLYPGLASHPGHEIAARQMHRGFGGLMSLLVRGNEEEARGVAARLRTFVRATSLGGVESLAEHRATVEGPDSVVPKNLIRLSVGLEDVGDLREDLEQALAPLDTER